MSGADHPAESASAPTVHHTAFSMLGAGLESAEQCGNRGPAAVVLLAAWFWPVLFIGRYRPNPVSRAVESLAPIEWLLGATLTVVAAVLLLGLWTRRKGLVAFCAMAMAFQVGHFVAFDFLGFVYLRGWFPFRSLESGLRFSGNRLAYLLGMLAPMVLVYALLFRGSRLFHFRWGSWEGMSRLFSAKEQPKTWRRWLWEMAVFSAILFVALQVPLLFAPIRKGYLWPAVGAVLVAALVNSLVEEALFRGLLQPALISAVGPAWGLWGVGALFGLVHWGASVGILAALPTSLLIGLGSVAWGKSVLETRGLGWVILAHAFVDVAVMSAYFVRP